MASSRPHLPVAVVSGLTVGVVSGLLVLRSGSGARAEDGAESAAAPEPAEVAQVAAADAGAGEVALTGLDAPAGAADAGAVDAAPPDASAAVAEAEDEREGERAARTVELSFDVAPASAEAVSIRVDGESVAGRRHSIEVEGPSRRVRVAVRARGFLTWSRRVRVSRDRELRIELERPEPTDEGPGGLIDL